MVKVDRTQKFLSYQSGGEMSYECGASCLMGRWGELSFTLLVLEMTKQAPDDNEHGNLFYFCALFLDFK